MVAAAEHKIATALFVDLAGFTELSDRLEPAVLVRILNGYYQRMSDAIDEHRGQVGSYIGDGIVAYFGALQPNPWQCDDAVRAALAMREAIHVYNVELDREGLPAGTVRSPLTSAWRRGLNPAAAWRLREVCFAPNSDRIAHIPVSPSRARSRRYALTLHVSSYHRIHRTISPL
jgi:class 3 adenylate cyclase